jgi:hypothetical protein
MKRVVAAITIVLISTLPALARWEGFFDGDLWGYYAFEDNDNKYTDESIFHIEKKWWEREEQFHHRDSSQETSLAIDWGKDEVLIIGSIGIIVVIFVAIAYAYFKSHRSCVPPALDTFLTPDIDDLARRKAAE